MSDMVETLSKYPLLIHEKINGKSAKDHTIYLARREKELALRFIKLLKI